MALARTTWGLVWSRIRFDWKRHATAVAAVAILMASFLTFDAVGAGMESALKAEIQDGRQDRVQLSTFGFGGPNATQPSLDVTTLAAIPGVLNVSPRSAKASGIEVPQSIANNATLPPGFANISNQLVLIGLDAQAESVLVEAGSSTTAAGNQAGGLFQFRGRSANNYSLLQGSWILGPGQGVATQSAATAGYGLGATFTVDGTSYQVVGIIGNFHPANLNIPNIRNAGQLLVDRGGATWDTIGGAFLEVQPDVPSIRNVYTQLIGDYPLQAATLQANLAELERQFYEQSQTQQVLSAAARLVGAAGAATLFAMSLFLLIGERKSIGALASIGFSRARLASYMNQKMLYVALLGCVGGGALGWVIAVSLNVPTASFATTPVLDASTYGAALAQTLASALLGTFVAFFVTIRKDPIQAITAAD